MKHTPGPWISCKTSIYRSGPIYEWVATTNRDLVGMPEDQEREEANAKLIVRSPDMLSIIKEMVAQYSDFPKEVVEEVAPDWYWKAVELIEEIEN